MQGATGLKSSTNIRGDHSHRSKHNSPDIAANRDIEEKKLKILPPVRNSLNIKDTKVLGAAQGKFLAKSRKVSISSAGAKDSMQIKKWKKQ